MHRQLQHRRVQTLIKRASQKQILNAQEQQVHVQCRSYAKSPEQRKFERKMNYKAHKLPITDNFRGSVMREEGDFDERYRLIDHNRQYPNAARNRALQEKLKDITGAKKARKGPPEFASLDEKKMRHRLTDEDVNKRTDEEVCS